MCVYFQGQSFLENKLVKDELKEGAERWSENKHVYMKCRFSLILMLQEKEFHSKEATVP